MLKLKVLMLICAVASVSAPQEGGRHMLGDIMKDENFVMIYFIMKLTGENASAVAPTT